MAVTDHEALKRGTGERRARPERNASRREDLMSKARLSWLTMRRSPLTRKIITFNLVALNLLVAGILYLNASRDGLALQRANALVVEAELIADVFEAQISDAVHDGFGLLSGVDVARTLSGLDLRGGIDVYVYDAELTRIGEVTAGAGKVVERAPGLWLAIRDRIRVQRADAEPSSDADAVLARFDRDILDVIDASLRQGTHVETGTAVDGSTIFAAASPILHGAAPLGAVAIVSASGEIDALVRSERERVLQIFMVATIVSVGLSLVLASTISNPISDLADAAERGREGDPVQAEGGRVHIPDLTSRPDEIGRLSGALRNMVNALYERIDANEQFAADVAHEIKNPMASLRSAAGTLRVAKREEQREKLLSVIEHDVRRIDRLVSDISNASRLDSELVKEDQAEFNLLQMLENIGQFLGDDARDKGIEFITDLPREPILLHGLEARLAQVFVNLISNAVSFCEDGDAIRVWARQKSGRVLVVVEDTGPGIPEDSLQKVFKRFYSHRPEQDFGNNSGLGLAISKQIVEAHGGVIWAENIRPTMADLTSDALGARFIVGLPV